MVYKGYEIRRVKTKFVKNDTPIEVDAWGIYANGDFKGSALTEAEARDSIDRMSEGVLYRPRERGHVIQTIDYNTHGNIERVRISRG